MNGCNIDVIKKKDAPTATAHWIDLRPRHLSSSWCEGTSGAQTTRTVWTPQMRPAEAPCPVARRASKFRGVANSNSAQTNQIERGGANLQQPLRSTGFVPSATFPTSLALILSRHFHIRFLVLGLVDIYLMSSCCCSVWLPAILHFLLKELFERFWANMPYKKLHKFSPDPNTQTQQLFFMRCEV